MKLNFLIPSILIISLSSNAQNPVTWNYAIKEVADKTYEVRLTASIQNGWHLYSQKQPEDAIALPTEIEFKKNPLVELKDKVKEIGNLEKYLDKTLDIEAWQYSDKLEFVQTVKLKVNAKTNIAGSIKFQTCNSEKCLPPKTVTFSLSI